MRKSHSLKTLPEHYQEIKARRKKAELRKNDRDYRKGDLLILEEWSPTGGGLYTGEQILAIVTHILADPEFGLKEGYVLMSIEVIRAFEAWEDRQ